MLDASAKIMKARTLINAQTPDNAWFSDAAALLDLDPKILHDPLWYETHWNAEWGEYIVRTVGSTQSTILQRTDGGRQSVLVSENAIHVQLIRLALTGLIIKLMPETGHFTYMEVGMPYSNMVKIFVNGKEAEKVVVADAILGYIEVYARDAKGNFILSNEKDELRRQQLNGVIDIVLQEDKQSFF